MKKKSRELKPHANWNEFQLNEYTAQKYAHSVLFLHLLTCFCWALAAPLVPFSVITTIWLFLQSSALDALFATPAPPLLLLNGSFSYLPNVFGFASGCDCVCCSNISFDLYGGWWCCCSCCCCKRYLLKRDAVAKHTVLLADADALTALKTAELSRLGDSFVEFV